jgi:acyl-CoA thioesterase II
MHACLHVFTSDISSGFGDLRLDGVPPAGASIDHSVWFHGQARADDWIIYDCKPSKVGGHRGLYTGTAHDLSGTLVAMLAQEMLLRPAPSKERA